jgi:hypothetical protein
LVNSLVTFRSRDGTHTLYLTYTNTRTHIIVIRHLTSTLKKCVQRCSYFWKVYNTLALSYNNKFTLSVFLDISFCFEIISILFPIKHEIHQLKEYLQFYSTYKQWKCHKLVKRVTQMWLGKVEMEKYHNSEIISSKIVEDT